MDERVYEPQHDLKRWKIAIVVSSGNLSGAEKRSAKLANALNARGHEAVLFLNSRTHAAFMAKQWNFNWPKVVVWSYPILLRIVGRARNQFTLTSNILGIAAFEKWAKRRYWAVQFKRQKIDIVHVFRAWDICNYIEIPNMFEVTSPDMARQIVSLGVSFPRSTAIQSNSESVEDALNGYYEENARFLPPHAFFEPEGECGPDRKEKVVLFAHRFAERKNPLEFAAAAVRFLQQRPDWRVAIRGQGPLHDRVFEIIRSDVNSKRIDFGFNANMIDEMRRSSVFVSVETEDNYSNQSVLEAMWCKNALILSDRGRTRARYFNDNGILCEPTVDSIFTALMAITSKPEVLRVYGERSRQLVDERFQREEYLTFLEGVYHRVIENHSKG